MFDRLNGRRRNPPFAGNVMVTISRQDTAFNDRYRVGIKFSSQGVIPLSFPTPIFVVVLGLSQNMSGYVDMVPGFSFNHSTNGIAVNSKFLRYLFYSAAACNVPEYGQYVRFFDCAVVRALRVLVTLHPRRGLALKVVTSFLTTIRGGRLGNGFCRLPYPQAASRLLGNIKTMISVSRIIEVNPVLFALDKLRLVRNALNNIKAESVFPVFIPGVFQIRATAFSAAKRRPMISPPTVDVCRATNVFATGFNMGNCVNSRDNIFVRHEVIIPCVSLSHNCNCRVEYQSVELV